MGALIVLPGVLGESRVEVELPGRNPTENLTRGSIYFPPLPLKKVAVGFQVPKYLLPSFGYDHFIVSFPSLLSLSFLPFLSAFAAASYCTCHLPGMSFFTRSGQM